MVTLLALIAIAQPSPQNTDTYQDVWRKVESAIRTRYYARESRKDEMERLLSTYGPLASSARTRETFAIHVQKMIEEFGDSHFALETDADQGFYFADAILRQENAKGLPFIGAWFEPAPNGQRVRYILNASEAEEAGLRPGDVVIHAADRPFQPVYSFMTPQNKTVELTVQRGSQQLTIHVQPQTQNAIDAFYAATMRSTRIIQHDGKRYAYGRIWSMIDRKFADHIYNWLLRGAGQNSDGFILDLRDGFGGRPENFYEPLFAPEHTIEWNMGQLTIKQLTGYQKPVVVLINGGTRSAKEVVSAILKDSDRALLVGSPTKGDVLGTFPLAIEDWAYLEIPMVDLRLNGKRLERAPVEPHIHLPREYGDSAEDLFLARALQELSQLSGQIRQSSLEQRYPGGTRQ